MLTRLDLRHFKCFELLKLPVRPLTLLSGPNASGKSTVIQALVLLHQTMREHEWSSHLMLNGGSVSMGTGPEIINQPRGDGEFGISLFDDSGERFEWIFEDEQNQMSMAVKSAWGESTKKNSTEKYEWNKDGNQRLRFLVPEAESSRPLIRRMCLLTYLAAERLGPREKYVHADPEFMSTVGPRGEYAVSILHSHRNSPALSGLLDENHPPTLFHQVAARMAQFFPGCGLEVDQFPRTNTVMLGIRNSNSTVFDRPTNTGFGVTQLLPIIVAAMSAEAGDLLLIENPEAHLHPAGQAMMGEFLAQVTSAGVQVMLETHSDHVLNGIRRAVKSKVLPSEDVALHFFRPPGNKQAGAAAQVECPAMDANGNIDSWPHGFFDQFDKDMNYFAGWG